MYSLRMHYGHNLMAQTSMIEFSLAANMQQGWELTVKTHFVSLQR